VPLARWSAPELARHAITEGICTSISSATVRRLLAEDALKPWQYQSWIFLRDPHFATKAEKVLDLYARIWEGQPLSANEFVISADEKPSIQARCRCHPTLPPGRSRMMRVNHDYHRRGALAYFAAYDVHHARVFGRCEDTTGIEAFTALVAQVMTTEPYASAKHVFWVVDNGSSHRGAKAIDRLTTQFPNAVMVHTPVHASWLNQVEIYFSIIQRKVLSPNTSPTSTPLSNASPTSRSGTTPPRGPSSGNSPPPTSPTSWNDSSDVSKPTRPPQPSHAPHDPRRTYERDH